MNHSTISLVAGSSTERLQALAEVQDFSVDPETGLTYRLLSEPSLTAELVRLATTKFDRLCDSVSLQPCLESRNEDRCIIETWDLPGGQWSFSAILDGHCGHDLVDYVVRALPSVIRDALRSALGCGINIPSDTVRSILSTSLVKVDRAIQSDFLKMFSGIVEDSAVDFKNIQDAKRMVAIRCTQGAALILGLVDPGKKNQWTANLGDCQAVYGRRNSCGGWNATLVNPLHDVENKSEVRRIHSEHPGEVECIVDKRVIGFLTPTRAIGDTWLKLPAMYTRTVFAGISNDIEADADTYTRRLITPPYVIGVPDTYHHIISSPEDFVVMYSDGLPDLHEDMDPQILADRMVAAVGSALSSPKKSRGLAMHLLRDALGNDDAASISRQLTLESDEKWMDDTSVMVQRFQ
ncbi:protein serine/threonine phosphatase 2C [Athelia psychrophila]|uniref:Protein serine/threonine phosphatase 2C n=1 Tax=Athelia psychrophila TaxID=1759441 RepID=A0A166X8T0_9AGAM|nr:protein serine/threonine phosphatase 2C [Fibularhizoctonia sp. CBS 109695]